MNDETETSSSRVERPEPKGEDNLPILLPRMEGPPTFYSTLFRLFHKSSLGRVSFVSRSPSTRVVTGHGSLTTHPTPKT